MFKAEYILGFETENEPENKEEKTDKVNED